MAITVLSSTNHENARKQNVLSLYALWGLARPQWRRRRTSCVRRLSSFDDRQAIYRSVMSLHRLLIGLYDYQACSVDLKMDVCMHKLQESRSQTTVNRSTEFEVTTSLRRNTVCTSMIVGYGVKMKRRLCVSVQCAGRYFFSPKLTKTSLIRDRLLLSSKRSSLSLYRLRVVWALTEKQPVSTSLGVFRHEVAWTDLPRKHQLTWSFISLANEALQVKKAVCWPAPFFFWFFLSKLVRSWHRPICREMTGISHHEA